MYFDGEKKMFVIRHTFNDVKNLKNNVRHYGNKERHFNIPWSIYIVPNESVVCVVLSWYKFCDEQNWSIDATVCGEFVASTREKLPVNNHVFFPGGKYAFVCEKKTFQEYLVDGNLTVECHVTINKMKGIEKPFLKSFNDESAKEFSDIVLKVKDQEFHVFKMYLASHSSYFKSLFFGNFDESKQSELELKDIDPFDFQKFLEVIYGEPVIDDYNIEGILQLADMYDAKTVIRQCEQFLLHRSQKSLKRKFNDAFKYNMDHLKEKCISELKSVEDIKEVIPEDDSHIDKPTSMKLLKMAIDFHEKK